MLQVMLDLETMGSDSDAAVVAIGAVKFDPATGKTGEEFYEVVDLQSSVDAGMRMNVSTVMWWMRQEDEARKKISEVKGVPLRDALVRFSEWFGDDKPVWGDGATFDNVILSNAYSLTGLKRPWSYRSDRCYRTMKNLKSVPVNRVGTFHCAVDDARTQAAHLMEILKLVPDNGCM